MFVKKSFNPTHTYVDLFIRFFLLNDGQGTAGLAERAHDDSQYMVPEV